jgi:Mn-dependent DtxR family transcriptional regulator
MVAGSPPAASAHPYTKIAFIERDLEVSRLTATKYLDALAEQGFLQKQ